jgi:hypothetical protein
MKYTGGCHCGKVRYEVELPGKVEEQQLIACNCSICSKKGHVLAFTPASAFTLLSGEDSLTDYQFNTMNVHHLFCKVCGVQSFTRGTGRDGSPMCSINVRCLDEVDSNTLQPQLMNGRTR